MRLRACSCGSEHLERIPRSWWMRVFASRRHYRCSRCRSTMFIRKPALQARLMPFAQAALHRASDPAA